MSVIIAGVERAVIEPAKLLEDPEEQLRETIRLNIRGIIDHGPEFTLLFPERHHLDPTQQEVVAKRIQNYRTFVRDALREMADQGKLRDLDINIAQGHILQTIVGIARWYTEGAVNDEAHLVQQTDLVQQTVDYHMSAILKR
jgi:hypothetical protein